MNSHGGDRGGRRVESQDFLTCNALPKNGRTVLAARHDISAIPRKGRGSHSIGVAELGNQMRSALFRKIAFGSIRGRWSLLRRQVSRQGVSRSGQDQSQK